MSSAPARVILYLSQGQLLGATLPGTRRTAIPRVHARGLSRKPVRDRRGPATVRGPRRISERSFGHPLELRFWEGERVASSQETWPTRPLFHDLWVEVAASDPGHDPVSSLACCCRRV